MNTNRKPKSFVCIAGSFASNGRCPDCSQPGWNQLGNFCPDHFRIRTIEPLQKVVDHYWGLIEAIAQFGFERSVDAASQTGPSSAQGAQLDWSPQGSLGPRQAERTARPRLVRRPREREDDDYEI